MKNNFEKFQQILEKKQYNANTNIKDLIEKIKNEPINIGYIEDTLKNKYGANLPKKFSNLIPFNQYNYETKYSLVIGQIWEDDKKTHPGCNTLISELDSIDGIIFFEQGLIASLSSWSHSFDKGRVEDACLSYMFDDMSYYYIANKKNRLNEMLNSNSQLSKSENRRSRTLIERIVRNKISKYNSQPVYTPTYFDDKENILVIDQSFGDASTVYGLADEDTFERMLLAAITENPSARIIVKTHPDSVYAKGKELNKRAGFFSGINTASNIVLHTDPINPYSMLNIVDKVYVGTSGLGMEALLAGKSVVCFGAPFYSGWGLTDDRCEVPLRQRERTLEELFYYTYIWYTHYLHPYKGECELEDVLDFIEQKKNNNNIVNNSHPKLSIIAPVHNVEEYLKECIDSILSQTFRNFELILIDDCSTDGSRDILEYYANVDSRIVLINLDENIGQGFARNIGIESARGEFIWFIDSDDYLSSDRFFEKIISLADKTDAEMIRAGKSHEQVEDINGKIVNNRPDKTERYFEGLEGEYKFSEVTDLLQNRHFWVFLYKKEFLDKNFIRFTTTQWEEKPFLMKSFLNANKIYLSNIKSTVYRVRQDSTARRKKNKLDISRRTENFRQIVELFESFGDEFKYHYKFLFSQYIEHLVCGFSLDYILENNDKEEFKKLVFVFNQSTLLASDLISDPININNNKFFSGFYHVLLDAVRFQDIELLEVLIKNKKISFEKIYQRILGRYSESRLLDYIKYIESSIIYGKSNKSSKNVKLIIHAGSSKTGSTYIQHVLERNRSKLLREGVWVPEFGCFWQKDRPHKQAGHVGFLHEANRKQDVLLNKLHYGVENLPQNVNTIIVSSEAFFLADNPHKLVDYFVGFDTRCLVYLRRQDEWANSQYREFVAGGAVGKVSCEVDEWLRQQKTQDRLDYNKTLIKWESKLPRSKIFVRRFGRKYFINNDLLIDFFESIGLNSECYSKLVFNVENNEFTLSRSQVLHMLQFNKLFFKENEHYLRFVEQVHIGLSKLKLTNQNNASLLSYKQREDILDEYNHSNVIVSNKYFDGECLFSREIKKDDFLEEKLSIEEVLVYHEAYRSQSGYEDIKNKLNHRNVKNNTALIPKRVESKRNVINRNIEKKSKENRILRRVSWKSELPSIEELNKKSMYRSFCLSIVKLYLKCKGNTDLVDKINKDSASFFINAKKLNVRVLGQLIYQVKMTRFDTLNRAVLLMYFYLQNINRGDLAIKMVSNPKQFFVTAKKKRIRFLGKLSNV